MSFFKRQDKPDGLVLYSDDTSTSNYDQSMPTSCAWCNQEAGRPQGNGSHGICTHHEAIMMQSARDRRANRNR